MIDDSLLLARAEQYAKSRSIRVLGKESLGCGSDGSVWKTSRKSAVKALFRLKNYCDELECYRRLKNAGVSILDGFHIPTLVDYDDNLMVIEMTIVEPPYLLDFGKVYLDRPPPYYRDRQLMKNAHAEWREWYGKQWTNVAGVVSSLERYGIYYVDPRPSNIDTGVDEDDEYSFRDYDEPDEDP